MKITNRERKLTLNKEEADALVKASIVLDDIMDLLLESDDENCTFVDVIGEVEITSKDLYKCSRILDDFIMNYGSDGEDTAKYILKWD